MRKGFSSWDEHENAWCWELSHHFPIANHKHCLPQQAAYQALAVHPDGLAGGSGCGAMSGKSEDV